MVQDGLRLLDRRAANLLVGKLVAAYPNTGYYLDFGTPVDLLAAAILSAQTRDEGVNRATPALFSRFKTAKDYAAATQEEIIRLAGGVSFAANKAKNIIGAMKAVQAEHGGKVPADMAGLLALPGVGRKTANTVLINAFGIVEGIPVDTWVIKLSPRLGLSSSRNPDKIEQNLMALLEKRHWHDVAYILKAHGKALCGSVPACSKCPVTAICPKNCVKKRS